MQPIESVRQGSVAWRLRLVKRGVAFEFLPMHRDLRRMHREPDGRIEPYAPEHETPEGRAGCLSI